MEVALGHFDDELPCDVELANLGDRIDEERVGVVGERGVGEGFGVVEEGEGYLGMVLEAEEGLEEEVGGEGDAVELEARFGGVEGVVVLQQEIRHQFCVVGFTWWRWNGTEAAEEERRKEGTLTEF
ncbi:hypothetical protein VIGAN_01520500 [Vigna angularis var. angularis]|uniref:Uncharacterized protein n=1 Tax=Vigna angularis var. angularis TaxID=157739 RepID=A0A0S3R974_PHAAN|nr:hypothetical protein VIGAN_01520500 [Vigna angularis var. angularis]